MRIEQEAEKLMLTDPDWDQSPERPSKARRVDSGDKLVFIWHRDSYPLVWVTMISDCTNMSGGETALRTANNEVLKVRA